MPNSVYEDAIKDLDYELKNTMKQQVDKEEEEPGLAAMLLNLISLIIPLTTLRPDLVFVRVSKVRSTPLTRSLCSPTILEIGLAGDPVATLGDWVLWKREVKRLRN